ncbi:hypothetical protein PXI34_004839 [Klebsiella pneumoniae]|nr:hypothetical protein [Klebsiella pneumoniae]EKZ5977219.1 hypothetical protein [Klebsiella pneumoniae]
MKNESTYTDEDIMKLEDDVLGLKITVHVLIQLLAKSNNENLDFLIKNLSFQANHFENDHPDFPGTIETLDSYFREAVKIYKDSSKINE